MYGIELAGNATRILTTTGQEVEMQSAIELCNAQIYIVDEVSCSCAFNALNMTMHNRVPLLTGKALMC